MAGVGYSTFNSFFPSPPEWAVDFPGHRSFSVYILLYPYSVLASFFSSNFMLLWSEQAYRLQMNERIFDLT